MEAFCCENISYKARIYVWNQQPSTNHELLASNVKSFIIIAQLVSWVNLVSSLVSGENASGCPQGEWKKAECSGQAVGGFSELSASIQSTEKTSTECIELLFCVCYTVIADVPPPVLPHIRTWAQLRKPFWCGQTAWRLDFPNFCKRYCCFTSVMSKYLKKKNYNWTAGAKKKSIPSLSAYLFETFSSISHHSQSSLLTPSASLLWVLMWPIPNVTL